MFKSIFSAVIFAFVVSGCATRVNPGYFMAKSVAVGQRNIFSVKISRRFHRDGSLSLSG